MRTFTYSVFDIYGTTEPKIPAGWEVMDFRPPMQKDTYLHENGFVDEPVPGIPEDIEDDSLYNTPYLILRKKRGPKKAVPAGRTSGGKKSKKI